MIGLVVQHMHLDFEIFQCLKPDQFFLLYIYIYIVDDLRGSYKFYQLNIISFVKATYYDLFQTRQKVQALCTGYDLCLHTSFLVMSI